MPPLSTRKLPESFTYFIDVDLGIHFFTALSTDERFRVEFHDQHFPRGTDDSVWLTHIAERGWIAVTHDRKMRRDHRPIIARARARVIVVVGRRPLAEQAENFLATYSSIERFVRKHSGRYMAKLYCPTEADRKKLKPKGRLEMWGEW